VPPELRAGEPIVAEAGRSARLSRRTSNRLVIVAAVTAVTAVIGAANAWLLSRLVPFAYDFAEFENGLRNGATIGVALIALELFYVQEPRGAWLRRASFAFGILDRATLYALIIALTLALNRLIFGLLHGFERSGLDYFGLPWLRDAAFVFVVFLAISFVLQMRRVVGGRVLTSLLLGRYHRPVREERVFMLVDIKGSTAIAERLGDERAHAFITSVFFDIDRPILEHGGEVHSYIGDELIASCRSPRGCKTPAVSDVSKRLKPPFRRAPSTTRARSALRPQCASSCTPARSSPASAGIPSSRSSISATP
jgi:hypothetical protein